MTTGECRITFVVLFGLCYVSGQAPVRLPRETDEGVKKLGLCLVALSGGVSLRNFRKRVVYVKGNLFR